jgi:Na+/H+-dicarboxylate symporter
MNMKLSFSAQMIIGSLIGIVVGVMLGKDTIHVKILGDILSL